MSNSNIYVSELSTSKHLFKEYHFCRGHSNRRKTRIGVILKGHGTYIYLNKRLSVSEGDIVFIPENIYCYSEWHGRPDIEVVYVSCFMHYESFCYEPQKVDCDQDVKDDLLEISSILSEDSMRNLEAYSLFYRVLQKILPKMVQTNGEYDKALQTAIEYITNNWNNNFSVAELAKKCCISESALYHTFQKKLGQTPISLLNSIRINIAIEYLENSNYSISTVSRMVGFNSENHFRRTFCELVGTTPFKYRKEGKPNGNQ